MARLTLKIAGDTSEIKQSIAKVQTELKTLGNQPIKIRFEAVGLTDVEKSAIKLANAQAKIAAANAKTAQTEAKVTVEREKTTQATEKRKKAESDLLRQIEKTNTEEAKLANTQARANAATEKGTQAAKRNKETVKGATREHELLGDSLDKIAVKMLVWQVMGTVVSRALGAFREAIRTLKEVDQELTNIAKVSNLTPAEIARIGDSAYDVASRYGVSASEYLSSVYVFQKAGLGESSEQMAELATKTMLVGDTTADVASKFLVAVNAAWELNGSMSALSKVVDETDYINNNYATDLEKLADGMPIVASTAANMNMSFEETVALLGTINSKTQETGRKTATAVRSFLIAISGQVGEFVDDVGETYEVTTENIEALTDALKVYGNEAVQHALATGEVINPMEALNSLAQAYRDNLISDIELEDMLIKVAGKMRYNQLVTIVKDLASETSTYREILDALPTSAGTANAEIETMLSSWEAKTQILENTWTRFISHLVDTNAVKGSLDALTGAINFLDSGVGKFALTLGLVITTAALAGKGFEALALKVVSSEFLMSAATRGVSTAFKELWATMSASPMFWITAVSAAIYGLVELGDLLVTTTEESAEKIREAQQAYQQTQAEIESVNAKLEENKQLLAEANELGRNDAYTTRLKNENEQLEIQLKNLEAIAAQKNREAAEEAKNILTGGYTIYGGADGQVHIGEAPLGLSSSQMNVGLKDFARDVLNRAITGNESAIGIVHTVFNDLITYGDLIKDTDTELYESIGYLVNRYGEWLGTLDEANSKQEQNAEITAEQAEAVGQKTASYRDYLDLLNKGDPVINSVAVAERLLALYTEQAGEKSENAAEAASALVTALLNEKGALTDNAAAALEANTELRKVVQAEIDARIEAARADYTNIILQLDNVRNAASDAARQIAMVSAISMAMGTANDSPITIEQMRGIERTAAERGVPVETVLSDFLQSQAEAKISKLTELSDEVSHLGDNVTTGGNTGKETDPELEKLKAAIDLLKSELSLMQARGDATEDIIAKQREIQAALHDEAEYLRSIGADQSEINALSAEWWNIQNNILKAQEEIYKQQKETLTEYLKAAEESTVGPLKEQLEILKGQRDALKDARDEEEKLLAVEKARIALENAQRERTIRVYNRQTGQWEWQANAANVQSARDSLADAERALADFYADQEIERLEAEIEDKEALFAGLADSAEYAAQQMRDAGWSLAAATYYLDSLINGGGVFGGSMVMPASGLGGALSGNAGDNSARSALARKAVASGIGNAASSTRIGSQHNGDNYSLNFGALRLDSEQMQNMTLAQFARIARNLGLY